MVLTPGSQEGGPKNHHRGSDQWPFVVDGKGLAIVNRKKYPLSSRTLLLIERNNTHEIRHTSKYPLKTLNIYVPPAYRKNGDPLARGRA